MKKTLLKFDHFREYASFLLEAHLDELVQTEMKRSYEVKLPLLDLLDKLNESQLYELSKRSISEYLTSIKDGTVVQVVEKSMEDWKADKLPGIPKEKLLATDIALIYNVRKHSLMTLLPRFTTDLSRIITILKEIEDFYTFQEVLAIDTYAQIKREEIERKEFRLREAQKRAKLGFWDYDVATRDIRWSDELYAIYGLQPNEPILGDKIRALILEEDLPALLEKVQEISKNGGSFTHEYRIRRTDGQLRILSDTGYTERDNDDNVVVRGISQDITDRKQIEQELIGRETLLQEAQAIAHLGSWEWDTILNKVNWSDEMYRLFGYEPKEVWLDYEGYLSHIYPDDREILNNYVTNCFLNQTSYALEHRIITKQGNIKWLQAKGKVTQSDGVKVLKMAGVAVDITEQKEATLKLEQSEALLLETQELARVGSYEWNLTSDLSVVTPEILRILGYKDESNPSCIQFGRLIHPDDKERVEQQMQEAFASGKPYSSEFKIVREIDGELRHVWSIGKIGFDQQGKPVKMVGSVMDITERKIAQEALQAKTEALVASNRELEAFCYTISHDLRSPLRAIDGFGKLLTARYGDSLDQEGLRLLNVVRTNAQRMGVMIDCLLDFSRLNRKEIRKLPFQMELLVRKVVEECKEQIPDSKASICIHDLHQAPADKDLLHQVWHNLIDNAIKFSSKHPTPRIEISSEKKADLIEYAIKDNGAGFDMQYRDKLFGVFQRLHSNDEFAGTGVGLATVQRIIHRHGGHVWAESELGRGACFYFTLPHQ